MARRSTQQIVSFSFPEHTMWLLDRVAYYAQLERSSNSEIVRRAISEYIEKHGVGNPQTPLLKQDRTHPYTNPVVQHRSEMLADLLADIRGKPGQKLMFIVADWGRVHGLREKTAMTYIRQLQKARKVFERGGKIYPLK